MGNQNRLNDHLFNKLFVAYAELYKRIYTHERFFYSKNLREIVDKNASKMQMYYLEYHGYKYETEEKTNNDNLEGIKEKTNTRIPSGITIKNYSDDLYDHKDLPYLAKENCRKLLCAIYKAIYKEAEERRRLSEVKDTIATVIHKSRELSMLEYEDLRKWIDDLDHVFYLVDLSLLSSLSEIETFQKNLVDLVLSDEKNDIYIQPIQFIIGSSETGTATKNQNEIINFRNNLRPIYSDDLLICRVTKTSKILRDFKKNCLDVSSDEKYIFILDNIVSNEDELAYQLIKRGTGSGYPLLEMWVKENNEQRGRQNDSGIRVIKDANDQGYKIKSYKDIADILLDVFESLVRDDQHLAEHDIRINNAHLYVDGKELTSLEHSLPYNSTQAELLRNKISDLEASVQYHKKEMESINERIDLCRNQLQNYRDSMDEILTMLICNRDAQDSDLRKYLEGEDRENALNELDNAQWKKILKKGSDSIEKGLQHIKEYMDSRFLLIQILQSQIYMTDSGSNKDSILHIYEELEELSLKYNVRHDIIYKYADYLNRISLYEECIVKSERLLKLCEIYEKNTDLSDCVSILLGDAYKSIGKYSESLVYLNRVLDKHYDRCSKTWLQATVSKLGVLFLTNNMNAFGPVLDAVPKTVLEENYEDPDMIIIQARIYHDQGLYYSHNSQFKIAINSYKNAIRLYTFLAKQYEKDSLRAAETADRLTRSISNLSDLYLLPDNYNLELAESGYKKALKISEQYSAPHMFPRLFVSKKGIYMLKLSRIMRENKDYGAAIDVISDVITIRTSLANQNKKYRRGLIYAIISRANTYMEMNNLKMAKMDLEAAESILNDKETDDSSALLEVRCHYYSAWAIWKLMKRERSCKKQYSLAINFWDEFATMDPGYAKRKKDEFINKYKKALEAQET
jgi:hypothetical protein